MIFNNVEKIVNKQDKALFVELVTVYCKCVNELASKLCLDVRSPYQASPSEDVIKEIKDMGLITDASQLSQLEKALGSQYLEFIGCVATYLENKKAFKGILDKFNNKKRAQIQKEEQESVKPKVADFFAGAGGLSLGFSQAGYRICFANDFQEVCVNTYRFNHPEIPSNKILCEDIRKIVDNIQDYVSEDIDIVIGGPPCQGFSSANQQRIIDDPRNELYKYYIKAVTRLAPKFVLMENVRGMLSVADQVVEDFHNIVAERNGQQYSYDIRYELLNSADFGVAQSRERLIYIAIRNDVMEDRNITPSEIFRAIKESCRGNIPVNLQEALAFIQPLDAPRVKNMNEVDDEKTGKKVSVNKFTGLDNKYLKAINGGRRIPLIYNHKARYVNDINYDIYRLLNPGEDASDEKISDIMPYKNRLYCFKDKYYKLIPDKPSRTITAHLKMDCHSHIHPFQIRAITPREAARCQSFPDDYLFLGAYLMTYMEIGNAVPVLMANRIATIIKQYL